MPNIKILSESLRNQIAAGEVVERPSSVLKELLENSIDAEADDIKINLKEGGSKLIEVVDNGNGMTKEDANLSVKRYATSKISKKEDLFNINTLGFRGEALAAISSVSIFSLETKIKDSLLGTLVEVHSGHELENKDCGCNKGTKISIKDLFYNVPVRKKFLKSVTTELKNCMQIIEDIALSYPQINIKVNHNNKEIFKVFKENREERLKQIIGNEAYNKLIPLKLDLGYLNISGYTSRPGEIFKTRNNQKIFVNNRSIKDMVIYGAINESYHTFLEKGSYPAIYLFIQISPDLVDINVHPRKSEVRFINPQEIFQAVKKTIISSFDSIGAGAICHDAYKSTSRTFEQTKVMRGIKYNPSQKDIQYALDFSKAILDFKPPKLNEYDKNENDVFIDYVNQSKFNNYRIIGQAANKFIIIENNEELIFLDQHAIHERFRYEELIKAYKEKNTQSQKLLFPESIECTKEEFYSILEHIQFLEQIGFEINQFGLTSYQISAIPQDISEENLKETLLKVCEELGIKGESNELDANIKKALTYLSCRGAVKFGNKLSFEEMKKLVTQWISIGENLTCPHGRPFGFRMKISEIEKKVGR